ncbi:hypothetical protein JCM3770_003280 [Rhodotorula araucariae]
MLNRLPDEVLCQTLRYLLPPVTWRSTPRRHRILLALSRTCLAVARAAQKLLYEVVHIDRPTSATSWYHAVEDGSRARQLAHHFTRTLFISSSPGVPIEPALVERVFGTTPAIRELWLLDISVHLLSLSILPQLTACYMTKVCLLTHEQGTKVATAAGSSSRYWPCLPSLRVLALSECDLLHCGDDTVIPLEELLRTESLPRLTALAVTWSKDTSDPFTKRLDRQLSHLFLRRLPSEYARPTWRSTYPALPRDELSRMVGLEHLAVDACRPDDLAALASVPVELVSLCLVPGGMAGTEIERDVLSADLRCLDNLTALAVEQIDRRDQREVVSRESTRQECDARGVGLHEMRFRPHPLEEHLDERTWFRLTGASPAI